ncbi:MAG: hypothetical protein LQ342_006871 [Letrouitia transgressa]|nr:MAG: hypothetical protein LQ342_006871 [Letrouitia transgressa]
MPPTKQKKPRRTLRRHPPTPKPHRIPSSTESQIRSAFNIFAQPSSPSPPDPETDTDTDTDTESYLPTPSLKPALQSLGCLPAPRSQLQEIFATADPTTSGRIRWSTFLPLAELLMQEEKKRQKRNTKKNDDDDNSESEDEDGYRGEQQDDEDGDDGDDERESVATVQHEREEVDEAFRLFVGHGGRGGDGGGGRGRAKAKGKGKDQEERITLEMLRSVARALKEDVDEGVLRDMILEANGGAGDLGVGKGVGRREFEGVMRRAGVFK